MLQGCFGSSFCVKSRRDTFLWLWPICLSDRRHEAGVHPHRHRSSLRTQTPGPTLVTLRCGPLFHALEEPRAPCCRVALVAAFVSNLAGTLSCGCDLCLNDRRHEAGVHRHLHRLSLRLQPPGPTLLTLRAVRAPCAVLQGCFGSSFCVKSRRNTFLWLWPMPQ